VRALLASIAIPDDAKAWLLQGIAKSREEQRAYHQTVVQEIRTEIKEQEVLMDRLYDDRLHRLISEDFFRQRFDLLEEKHRQLSRDLARHQHAEGAYMELGSKLIELIAQAPQIFERADPGQRRELVGLLTSNRVLKGKTLEFDLRKPFDVLVSAANHENGWVGRIRTQYNDRARRPNMTSAEVRQRFLNFFKERDHKVLPSSPLIPFGDPTLLFTSAGMVPFKPYFLGQAKPPFLRVTTCQKVFRTVDIDVVGSDGHHLTFFEMLGNFSFGDYFKEKAIPYAYEFLTRELRIDKERLWAGIHNDDDESFEIWKKTGVPAERIRRFGDDYNFWAAGPTGPCGPDSEIHYDWGEEYSCGRPDCGPNCEHCDRFLEIWNLVFMQWNRDEIGKRTPLERKGIDTGMGLERITAVVNGDRKGVFETDLFQPLIRHFSEEAGKSYGSNSDSDASLRVLADHARGSAMLLADGVAPANDGRGYVLRRLIRRGMVHARRLGPAAHLSSGVPIVARMLGDVYPEVRKQVDRIAEAVRSEEERFGVALRQGMERLQPLLDRGTLNPEEVFYLHDTLGFPIELTAELAKELGVSVDLEAVAALMERQREKSRSATQEFTAPLATSATEFVGYDQLEVDATVTDVFQVDSDHADVYLDRTPFYAERGGQAADHGWLSAGPLKRAEVSDVQIVGEAIRHRVNTADWGWLGAGQKVHAAVDSKRRTALTRHHSATHLLHRALREVLGEGATQAGSSVLPEYATLDFHFARGLTSAELDRVSRLVNDKVRANLVRRVEVLPLAEALATGAVALFDEKYGDKARVVSFGEWARELCGGTHVERSGELGLVTLSPDKSIGTGLRRIELRAGEAAENQLLALQGIVSKLAIDLRVGPPAIPPRVEALQAEVKRLQKQADRLVDREAAQAIEALQLADVDGFALGLQKVDAELKQLRVYANQAMEWSNQRLDLVIVVGGKSFVIEVKPSRTNLVKAPDVIRVFTQVAGGKGGGRSTLGEGGGIDPDRVEQAFQRVRDYVSDQLEAHR
jgi:alanyl-tRNA synthetase